MRTLRSLAGAIALAVVALPSATPAQGAPPAYTPPPPPSYPPPPPYPPPPASPPSGPPHRSPWYIGFGLGYGNGSYVLAGDRVNYREHGAGSPFQIAYQFEIGATLTPKLLLGGEVSGLVSSSSQAGIDYTLWVGQLLAVATWFPLERGLFLRGGAGLSYISAYEEAGYGYSGYPYNGYVSSTAYGGALLAGVGYAWWLGRSFNLSIHGDATFHAYSGNRDAPSSSETFTGYLGFHWY